MAQTKELFEVKVWRVDSAEWRWKVRLAAAYKAFASGVATSRQKAETAADDAIVRRSREIAAPWKRVSR